MTEAGSIPTQIVVRDIDDGAARRRRGVRRLADDPGGRTRRRAPGRRGGAGLDLPGLPAARRPLLAHSRPRRRARRTHAPRPAKGSDDAAQTTPRSRSATRRRPSSYPTPRATAHALGRRRRAPATVVVFTCNHCPYALAWHERIADAARDYADRGVRFLAINSNDAEPLPEGLVRGDAGARRRRRAGSFPTCTTRARTSRAPTARR